MHAKVTVKKRQERRKKGDRPDQDKVRCEGEGLRERERQPSWSSSQSSQSGRAVVVPREVVPNRCGTTTRHSAHMPSHPLVVDHGTAPLRRGVAWLAFAGSSVTGSRGCNSG